MEPKFYRWALGLTALALGAAVALNAGSILVSKKVYMGRLTA